MPKQVSRASLIQKLQDDLGLSAQNAQDAVDLVFSQISDALADKGQADISGFGKFVLFHRKERMGINPNTGERLEIEASEVPKFRPSQSLKNKCNGKG